MKRIIIDAHLHLPVYSHLQTLEDKKRQLLGDLDRNDISAAVVIADAESPSVIGTNDECINLFSDCSNIFIMAGISPLIDYQANLCVIEAYLCDKKVVGIKIFPGHEEFYVNDPRLEEVFKLCEAYDVPFVVHTGWSNPQFNEPSLFAEIAERHPKLRIVNCHLWYPRIDECYEITRKYENIYYDISSLAYKKENIPKVSEALTRIAKENPHRLIFGTDYGACNHESHIDLIEGLPLDEYIKELIFYKNAVELYKLNIQS